MTTIADRATKLDPAPNGADWLRRYLDRLVDEMPRTCENLAEEVYAALPVGVDVAPLRHQLAVRRLDRLLEYDHGERVTKAVAGVRDCHAQALAGGVPDWRAAYAVAYSAAEEAYSVFTPAVSTYSMYSASYGACLAAISSASDSAGSVARSVARSAAAAVRSAADSAYSAAYAARLATYSASYARSARASRSAQLVAIPVGSSKRCAAWRQERADLLELIKELR